MSRILVALSGGVDSSVVVSLLKREGHDVEALCLKMSPLHSKAVEAAKKAAEALNITLHVLDASELFSDTVISDFVSEYKSGRTPNPCIVCNPGVKFKLLGDFAAENGFDRIATGHYANIKEIGGKKYISVAKNIKKDQSYMLYRLDKEIIDRLVFPLGSYESKDDVRAEAGLSSLPSASSPDSQEICFIEGDYADYIEENFGKGAGGNFIGPEGENLGRHKGVIHYTVGQRKGLSVSYRAPLYVKEIDKESGNIRLCLSGGEFFKGVKLRKVFFPHGAPAKEFLCAVKVRYSAKLTEAAVKLSENGEAEVLFSSPVRASCPGQSAVFYRDGVVLGGGIIIENM